jgi:hypothetical protein
MSLNPHTYCQLLVKAKVQQLALHVKDVGCRGCKLELQGPIRQGGDTTVPLSGSSMQKVLLSTVLSQVILWQLRLGS